MKFRKPTGHCQVCGKPTRLMVHQRCGDIAAAAHGVNKSMSAKTSKRNAAKYLAGRIPWFAKDKQ